MEDSIKLMIKRLHAFISNHHDYIPIDEKPNSEIDGFFNPMEHIGTYNCIINRPYKEGGKIMPCVVIGYESHSDGSVHVITMDKKRYALTKCDTQSVQSVYETLIYKKEAE